MGKGWKSIADPNDPKFQQATLFGAEDKHGKYNPYPRILSTVSDAREVIRKGAEEGLIGSDLEFNSNRPTILGVSCRDTTVAVRWDDGLAAEVIDAAIKAGATIVGHSTIGAEKQQYQKALGISTPVSLWDCSMIAHHMVNGDMTKMAGKDEADDAGALGLMGLSTVASLYTDLPNWKQCRGKYCVGPCPAHRIFDYCAVDSWASLAAFNKIKDEMRALNIPYSFYRDCVEQTDICVRMELNGVHVDRSWVETMEKRGAEYKATLFPVELVNHKEVYAQFNPKSGKQILAYCKENKIDLTKTTKTDIAKALEKQASKEGFIADNVKGLCEALELATEISPALDTLFRLYSFKNAGKGTKSWFDPKYFGPDGKVHARFVTTGSCTGRLSSSKPNYQNLGARGWAKELKKAIIPPEGYDFVESDFSQLELRVILYLAGFDIAGIGKDAFEWLVDYSQGAFLRAAAMASMSERDIAKSVSHGSDYLEGIQVLTPQEFESAKIKTEIEAGARAVYLKSHKPRLTRDWLFRDGIVTFTGANLAERLFGDKSLANRKKALEITEDIYFEKFFSIREWQMKVLDQAENGVIQAPTGRILRLYGRPADDAKMAVAFLGQGVGADHVRATMLQYSRLLNVIPDLNVHDSLVFARPKEESNESVKEFLSLMQQEEPLLPGFVCPGKMKRGPNYGSIEQI